MTPYAYESTEGVVIIDVRRARRTELESKYTAAVVLKLCMTVHTIHSKYSGAVAHTIPECGDECKTGEGTGTTRHGFELHTILRRCGYILSNLSLLAATSIVGEQSGRGQKLKFVWGMACGYSFTALLLTEIRHCSTRNTRNRIIFRGPKLSSKPFASASGDLHILFPFLFGTWGRV